MQNEVVAQAASVSLTGQIGVTNLVWDTLLGTPDRTGQPDNPHKKMCPSATLFMSNVKIPLFFFLLSIEGSSAYQTGGPFSMWGFRYGSPCTVAILEALWPRKDGMPWTQPTCS